MLTVFLAGSGNPVTIPTAVDVRADEASDKVQFLDAEGRTLVVFQRKDVVLFSSDGAHLLSALEAEEAQDAQAE